MTRRNDVESAGSGSAPTRPGSTPTASGRRKPASSPADTAVKRAADVAVAFGDLAGGRALDTLIAGLLAAGAAASGRAGLAADLAACALGAGYCLPNFWRCREAHCLVTGVGWAGLGAVTAGELAAGRSRIGRAEPLVFVAVLAAGYGLQAAWRARTGSTALRRTDQRQAPDTSLRTEPAW